MTTHPPFSVVELKQSFAELSVALNALNQYIASLTHMPYSLAPQFDHASPHQLMADTLTQMFYPRTKNLDGLGGKKPPKPTPPYGVLLIDKKGLPIIERASAAKSNFAAIASDLNKFDRSTRRGLSDKRARGDFFSEALAGHGLRDLSLQDCYKKLSMIEDTPISIGFTWQRNHRSWTKLSMCDAITLCESYHTITEDGRNSWLDTIRAINTKKFQIVRISSPKQPQLKANVTITPGMKGEHKHIPSPTIILLNCNSLPKITYRSLDDLNMKNQTRYDKVDVEKHTLNFLGLYAIPIVDKEQMKNRAKNPAEETIHAYEQDGQ